MIAWIGTQSRPAFCRRPCLPFNTHPLRTVTLDGQPWFVARDVCLALSVYLRADGTANTNTAVQKLSAGEARKLPYAEANRIGLGPMASRALGLLLVSESGLYRLVMRSDKPEARAFQDWATKTVLPAIRKDGAYVMGEDAAGCPAASRLGRHVPPPVG